MAYDLNTCPLDSIILCEPLIVYKSVRVENTGFVTSYLPALVHAYDNKGITCAQFASYKGWTLPGAYVHLKLVVNAGYLVKQDKRYYLTDTGNKIVLDAKREANQLINRLRSEFIKAAKRAIKR